jgi:DNA-binding MarR family transcriptional regulator
MTANYTFGEMVTAWREIVPAELKDEEPRILIRLLSIGDVGIMQRDLMQEFGIQQSRMSKLLSKLGALTPQLITTEESPMDRRWRRYRSTPAAAQLLGNLEYAMATFFPS